MALPKLFQRIFWHNNTTPAINEDNLNAISKAVDDIDDRVIELAGTIMEDVPQIQEDMEILGPAIENIDANVTRAETAADNAEASALNSEGYAVGEQDGVEVGPDSEYYQKNAKYYANIANPPIENTVDFTDIITITDAINKAAKDVKLKVEAVQDLHGYNNPWVGGAGKNKLKTTGTSTTNVGVSYNVNSDRTILVNGTADISGSGQDTSLFVVGSIELEGGVTYVLSSSAPNDNDFFLQLVGSGISDINTKSGAKTFTPSASLTATARIIVNNGKTVSNITIKPMVCLSTASNPTTFEPYTNICPISGWDNAKVTRSGKNLYVGSPSFDGYAQASGWTKQTETYNGHEVYKRSGAWSGTYKLVYLKEGTYTFSVAVKTSDSGQVGIFAAMPGVTTAVMPLAQKTHIATSTSWSKISFTFSVTTAGTVALRIEKEAAGDIYISEYQIESNSTATDFEPYKGNVYTIDLDGTRYGGTLDVTSGVLTVTKAIYDLGDYSYVHNTVDNRNYFHTTGPISGILGFANNTACDAISNQYVADAWNNIMVSNPSANGKIAISSDKYFGIRDNNANAMSTSEFKTYVTGVKVVATLATPITVQLTPTQVYLLYGYNTLFGDCGDISLTYDASGIIHIDEVKLDTETLKTIAAASSDFADFKARIAAL